MNITECDVPYCHNHAADGWRLTITSPTTTQHIDLCPSHVRILPMMIPSINLATLEAIPRTSPTAPPC